MKKTMVIMGNFIGLVLVFSVMYSGYRYTYYGDEVMHVHMMYLLASGYRIFTDFFSIHAPLFHYLLLPFVFISGFTLQSFFVLRIVMIILYMLRMWIGWLLASTLFSTPIAWLFVLLMLLDPFATFSAMQIRPDNLMMLVFTTGLLCVALAREKQQKQMWFLGGLCVTMSVLVSMKIAVSAGVFSLCLVIYAMSRKHYVHILWYGLGSILVVICFCLFFVWQGSFFPMLTQLLYDAKAMSDALWYPTRLGFFYIPDNAYIYGLSGRPVTWWIAVLLPLVGFGGFVYGIVRWRKSPIKKWWIWTLFFMLLGQYAFLFTVKSMFIQYYLTVNWILCLFAALFLNAFFTSVKKPVLLAKVLFGIGMTLFIVVSFESIRANIVRPTLLSTAGDDEVMRSRWEKISKNEPVYPVLLFRPLSQPIPYGYFIPEVPASIRGRYPSDKAVLSEPTLRYLILTPYQLQFIDAEAKAYIENHFTKQTDDQDLWIRHSL